MEIVFASRDGGRSNRGAFDWAVARNVFVAESTGDARRLAQGNSLGSCIQYILDLTRATAPNGVAMWKRDLQQADSDCTLDYFMNDVIIAGEPEHVTANCWSYANRSARSARWS